MVVVVVVMVMKMMVVIMVMMVVGGGGDEFKGGKQMVAFCQDHSGWKWFSHMYRRGKKWTLWYFLCPIYSFQILVTCLRKSTFKSIEVFSSELFPLFPFSANVY